MGLLTKQDVINLEILLDSRVEKPTVYIEDRKREDFFDVLYSCIVSRSVLEKIVCKENYSSKYYDMLCSSDIYDTEEEFNAALGLRGYLFLKQNGVLLAKDKNLIYLILSYILNYKQEDIFIGYDNKDALLDYLKDLPVETWVLERLWKQVNSRDMKTYLLEHVIPEILCDIELFTESYLRCKILKRLGGYVVTTHYNPKMPMSFICKLIVNTDELNSMYSMIYYYYGKSLSTEDKYLYNILKNIKNNINEDILDIIDLKIIDQSVIKLYTKNENITLDNGQFIQGKLQLQTLTSGEIYLIQGSVKKKIVINLDFFDKHMENSNYEFNFIQDFIFDICYKIRTWNNMFQLEVVTEQEIKEIELLKKDPSLNLFRLLIEKFVKNRNIISLDLLLKLLCYTLEDTWDKEDAKTNPETPYIPAICFVEVE